MAGTMQPKDLRPGRVLTGTITEVRDFGAYVDIGAEWDGFVHIAELGRRNVTSVEDVVWVGDRVRVRVLGVDSEGKRISLSMRGLGKKRLPLNRLRVGQMLRGRVRSTVKFGAFVDVGAVEDGLVHVSEMGDGTVTDPAQFVSPGDWIDVRVLEVDPERRRISLSMAEEKKEEPEEEVANEEEESELTAVELALRSAQGDRGGRRRAKRKKASRVSNAEVLQRTLRHLRQQKGDDA